MNQKKLKSENEIEIVFLFVSCFNEKSTFETLYINGFKINKV